jgi:fucose permease
MIAFPLVGMAVDRSGWRVAWSGIGFALLLVLVPLSAFAMRRNPASCGLRVDGETNSLPGTSTPGLKPVPSDTLGSALARPQFWIFAIGSALYGLVASGLGLFNESILAERGFPAGIYHTSLAITAITGLAGNFLGGWLMGRYAPTRLLAAAMGLLATGLGLLPHLATVGGVMTQAAGMGIAGGLVTVLFFSIWSRYFGRLHLATIQGAAQTLTVVGSALGPLWLAKVVDWTGSYAAGFRTMGMLVAGVGIWALLVREPTSTETLPPNPSAP